MIRDIVPKSSTDRLKRDYRKKELQQDFDAELVAAVVGMNRAFIARALTIAGHVQCYLHHNLREAAGLR